MRSQPPSHKFNKLLALGSFSCPMPQALPLQLLRCILQSSHRKAVLLSLRRLLSMLTLPSKLLVQLLQRQTHSPLPSSRSRRTACCSAHAVAAAAEMPADRSAKPVLAALQVQPVSRASMALLLQLQGQRTAPS